MANEIMTDSQRIETLQQVAARIEFVAFDMFPRALASTSTIYVRDAITWAIEQNEHLHQAKVVNAELLAVCEIAHEKIHSKAISPEDFRDCCQLKDAIHKAKGIINGK